jgi:hypothetical protein
LLCNPIQHEHVVSLPDGGCALQLYDTHVVTARPTGELVLTSGGFGHSTATQKSIAAALQLFGLTLIVSDEDRTSWSVSDGARFLRRFADGLVVPPNPQYPGLARAKRLLNNYQRRDTAAEQGDDVEMGDGQDAPRRGGRGGRGQRYTPY